MDTFTSGSRAASIPLRDAPAAILAVTVTVLAAPVFAQAPAIEPGLWHIWVTSGPARMDVPPQAEHCLKGALVQDLVLYAGETPGDSACRAVEARSASGAKGFSFRLACPGREGGPVVVSQAGRTSFTANLERSPSFPRVRAPVQVHGRHVGACR